MHAKDEDAGNKQKVILFADDDALCLDVGVRMMQKLGYTVLEARDGHEAIEVYKKNRQQVDLIILDMRMPHNGGLTFEKLRKLDSDVKILITSGYTEDFRIRKLLDNGCEGYIQKPFNLMALSQKILNALEN
jgi:CheY-like chemotaxis protein